MNIQDCFPLGLTGLISLQSQRPSRVFSNTTVQKQQFYGPQLSLWSNSHFHKKTIAFYLQIWKKMLLFCWYSCYDQTYFCVLFWFCFVYPPEEIITINTHFNSSQFFFFFFKSLKCISSDNGWLDNSLVFTYNLSILSPSMRQTNYLQSAQNRRLYFFPFSLLFYCHPNLTFFDFRFLFP